MSLIFSINIEKEKYHSTPLRKIFLRSFFLQAVFNNERGQGLGFGIAMLPVARKLKLEGKALADFLKRNFSYFNADPYFAFYALGASARMESDFSSDADINEFKEQLMGAQGKLGDRIFWHRLKPLALLIAVYSIIMISWPPIVGFRGTSAHALLVVLLLYNMVNLSVKWRGLISGYYLSGDLIKTLTKSTFARGHLVMGLICAFCVGLFLIKASTLSGQSIGFWKNRLNPEGTGR